MRSLARLLFVVALAALCCPVQLAQQPDPSAEARKREVIDHVHRARRLRDFGYPLLARAQLDKAKKLDPNSREMLVEVVRLFTSSDATREETDPHVKALLEIYPDDYEACFELARFLYMAGGRPSERPANAQLALDRLAVEMKVYRELGAYIATPGADLPASAGGKPELSLAFLARCVKKAPGSKECLYLAGQELFFRAGFFQDWAAAAPELAGFGKAAIELYKLAEPLFRGCAGSDTYGSSAAIYVVELLVRLGDYKAAQREAVGAELLNPGSIRLIDALGDVAEGTQDIELLVKALKRRHEVFGEQDTELDLRVATRIQQKGWPFTRWKQYRQLDSLGTDDRRQAMIAMIQQQPDFPELHLLAAINCLAYARTESMPAADRARWLDAALGELDKCKELADFPEWHVRRGATLWFMARYGEAGKEYEEAARLAPADTEAREMGRAGKDIEAKLYTAADYDDYVKLKPAGDMKVKRTRLLEIANRSPRFAAAWVALIDVCHILTDFDTARLAAQKALELLPNSFSLTDDAANAALEAYSFADAVKWYNRLLELAPERAETQRMLSLCKDLVAGTDNRRKAFHHWRLAQRKPDSPSQRRNNLELSFNLDPTFPETLIDLAVAERPTNPDRADRLLQDALIHRRDKFTEAAARRERGRLYAGLKTYAKAVREFEEAYTAHRADGADLLFASLALTQLEEHAKACTTMRQLFTENPGTPLLRARDRDLHALGLTPVKSDAPRRLSVDYSTAQTATFLVDLSVDGQGGGQSGKKLSLQYEARIEILDTPDHGGLWKLKLSFGEPPAAEFAALKLVNTELWISPWFGLVKQPEVVALDEVVNPVIQVLCEVFTCGLGDAILTAPYVWKNTLTKGPPHWDSADPCEASALTEAMGTNLTIERQAFSGRQIDDKTDPFQTEFTYTRGLRAWVKMAGPRRAIVEAGFKIYKKELTKERDDVVESDLQVKLTPK